MIDTIGYLQSAPKSTVIISNIDSYWMSDSIKAGLIKGLLTDDIPTKLALFQKGLLHTVAVIQNSGHEVILVQTVPYAGLDPLECSTIRILLSKCVNNTDRETLERTQGPVRQEIVKVGMNTSAKIFDPWDWMCSKDFCTTSTSKFFRYVNTNHISVPQSKELAHAFAITLEQ